MVERTVHEATSADVVEERSRRRALRCDTCAKDLRPGSQVQSRGGSDTPALPAGTKYRCPTQISLDRTSRLRCAGCVVGRQLQSVLKAAARLVVRREVRFFVCRFFFKPALLAYRCLV